MKLSDIKIGDQFTAQSRYSRNNDGIFAVTKMGRKYVYVTAIDKPYHRDIKCLPHPDRDILTSEDNFFTGTFYTEKAFQLESDKLKMNGLLEKLYNRRLYMAYSDNTTHENLTEIQAIANEILYLAKETIASLDINK